MPTMLLVRHGVTDWNFEGRVQGQTDRPLNDTGLAQARSLADELAHEPLVAVYASDLARARDTAAAVAARHGLEIVLRRDLREKNFGTWEGLTDTEIRERFPDAVRGSWGDGETADDLRRRAVRAVEWIRSRHDDGLILAVSHGGTMRAILDHLSVPHGRIKNCEIFRVEF